MSSPAKKLVNQVEQHAQLNERIKQESLHFHINENFTLNPRTLHSVAEKPNRVTPASFAPDVEIDETEQQLKTKLLTMTAPPKMKATYAVTSASEVGWDGEMPLTKQTWGYSKPSCDETKYASAYFTMTRRSPFSNKVSEPVKDK